MAELMNTTTHSEESPCFHRVSLEGPTWTNQTLIDGEKLVAEDFLEDYENSRADFIAAYLAVTCPEFCGRIRLLPSTNPCLLTTMATAFLSKDKVAEMFRAKNRLDEAVSRLAKTWDQVLQDARQRFGDRFDQAKYPISDSEVCERLKVNVIAVDDECVHTRSLLGKYSIYWNEPTVTLYDAIEAARHCHFEGQ